MHYQWQWRCRFQPQRLSLPSITANYKHKWHTGIGNFVTRKVRSRTVAVRAGQNQKDQGNRCEPLSQRSIASKLGPADIRVWNVPIVPQRNTETIITRTPPQSLTFRFNIQVFVSVGRAYMNKSWRYLSSASHNWLGVLSFRTILTMLVSTRFAWRVLR